MHRTTPLLHPVTPADHGGSARIQFRARVGRLATALFLTVAATCSAQTAPDFSAEHLTFFETQIRPVLVESCYECHSAQSR
ncbi:MAG: hypothetical protein ACK6EB_08475, partial [Planctomyces sp.]